MKLAAAPNPPSRDFIFALISKGSADLLSSQVAGESQAEIKSLFSVAHLAVPV